MPHTALYRKIRPRTFGEILGQPHIVRTLLNQLAAGQVSHAYLFCGTRGTGKTSAAKIFARAVNCFNPVGGEPCNTCEMCTDVLAERSLDVAEIDAASRSKVEQMRDLLDEIVFMPKQGRYKVYIVDEAHMLSGAAFNALLKTLEEPPAHVIFILATTDPQKIPATILSRCQRYDFRRISSELMTAALGEYLRKENVAFDESALSYIAYHSDGAMRDALSLLDQCLSVAGGDGLTLEKVRDLLGAVDRERLFDFTDALAAGDAAAIMGIIDGAMCDGRDVTQFAADLVRHFRDVLVAGLTGSGEFAADAAAKFKEQAKRVPAAKLMQYINAFSETLREMRFAPHMRTAFEVCALKMSMPPGEEIPAGADKPITPPAKPVITPPAAIPPVEIPSAKAPLAKSDFVKNWGKFCAHLPTPVRSMCAQCGIEEVNGMLIILCGNETTRKRIEDKQAVISKALAEFFSLDTPPNLAIEVREAYNKPINTPRVASSPLQEEAPAIPEDWANFGQVVLGGEDFDTGA